MATVTASRRRGVLPGFAPALGLTSLYVGLVVVLPLAALALKAASLTPADFVRIVTSPPALPPCGLGL